MTKICLVMIVKDEEHCLPTCLESVRRFIDRWVIIDTGSTDNTQEVIENALDGIPGVLLERPWVNFSHNRNEALQYAKDTSEAIEYALTLDADECLVRLPKEKPDLDEDGYYLTLDFDNLIYERMSLVRLDLPWYWEGVIHEYLRLPEGDYATTGALSSPRVRVSHAGARSKDPETYRKDAELIERELKVRGEDPRLRFYLAQSYRDAGDLEKALANYQRRVLDASGWWQEHWYAQFQCAVLLERLGDRPSAVISAYLDAYQMNPGRIEPLVEAARLERMQERFQVALLYAEKAVEAPVPPKDALFVDRSCYEWRRYDEFAVSAFWSNRLREGRYNAAKALQANPEDPRLIENVRQFDLALA